MNLGLVLTGGGARAAYQVGVIQAIADFSITKEIPFNVVTGVSTGAINGSYLFSRADNFRAGAQGLWDLWLNIHSQKVFRADSMSMAAMGTKWLGMLGAGSLYGSKKKINYLLDTDPLRELLEKELQLENLPQFFKDGILRGVAVSATNYLTGTAISFYDGAEDLKPWVRSTRLGVQTQLSVEHIMASSAIPIFFPPVKISGTFYGDGCIRLTSPLSPAIHLGADRLIAVGIRYPRTHDEIIKYNQEQTKSEITIAEISGMLLNAVFLDSLETDIERMERINNTISIMPLKDQSKMTSRLRQIPLLTLRPSLDLAELAIGTLHEFPSIIRFLLRGLGAKENKGWDLFSYLAFEKAYTNQLIELGYMDTLRLKNTILEFMYGEPKKAQTSQFEASPH
jgi:NTE family protein